jgi:hypothetical protein
MTKADGHSERHPALAVIEPRADRPRRVTLGFDMQRHIHAPQLIDEVFGMTAKAKGSAIVLKTGCLRSEDEGAYSLRIRTTRQSDEKMRDGRDEHAKILGRHSNRRKYMLDVLYKITT